jgi:hypothetical protein
MVTGIEELLLGVALEKVFDGVLAARRFVQAGPRERLLLLLHKDLELGPTLIAPSSTPGPRIPN